MNTFPHMRLRRYRQTPTLRRFFDQPLPGPERFVWPVFVVEGTNRAEPISAMPGQHRMSVDILLREVNEVVKQGIGGILIFGQVSESLKDPTGTQASHDNGIVQQSVRALRKTFPDLVIATDVCLCAYTRHGHCGPINERHFVDNDAAKERLGRVSVSHAAAGADIVAPSAMMDGQVQAIRAGLDDSGFQDTLIMSYSTKFASSMYDPFREAGQSAPRHGDRRTYQTSPANPRLAIRESVLDEQEGADILMVKPALFYLDILVHLRERTDLPIAAYNVSGEYAMVMAAAERGWGERNPMARESMLAISRAGADMIISYFARHYNAIMLDG